MLRRIPLFLASLIALAVVAYAILLAVLAIFQDSLIYPAPAGDHRAAQPGWKEIHLLTDMGGFSAYQLPARKGMPTLIFLHGNGYGYEGSMRATAGFVARGYGVMIPEYPGYGGNPGDPTEAGIDQVADAAYDWVSYTTPPSDIVIYGHSLGSGPAVHIARRPHALLLLASPVASMPDVVRARIPFAPDFLIRDQWRNEDGMRHVGGPVIVVHARDDDVVPYGNGVRMADGPGRHLISRSRGGHTIAFDPALSARLADDAFRLTHQRTE